MLYWLIANVILVVLCFVANKSVGQGDDFGAAFIVIVLGAIGASSTIAYVATAFWIHRFV